MKQKKTCEKRQPVNNAGPPSAAHPMYGPIQADNGGTTNNKTTNKTAATSHNSTHPRPPARPPNDLLPAAATIFSGSSHLFIYVITSLYIPCGRFFGRLRLPGPEQRRPPGLELRAEGVELRRSLLQPPRFLRARLCLCPHHLAVGERGGRRASKRTTERDGTGGIEANSTLHTFPGKQREQRACTEYSCMYM